MSAAPVAIVNAGLVTAVGFDAPSTCAAMRAKLTNPTQTRYMDSGGEWLIGHQVALEEPWSGLTRLAKMAAAAMNEALGDTPEAQRADIPVLLCVAEANRPGRTEGLDEQIMEVVQQEVGWRFNARSALIAHGRVGVAIALAHARTLIYEHRAPYVLIAATDNLLSWKTLSHYEFEGRLLTSQNSDGFLPGEGAGALLVGRPGANGGLLCAGVGFAMEPAHIESGQPLRADGLTQAIQASLADAGREMHHIDLRIADMSGEQYYFKEATLAVARTLRQRKEEFDIWHPAECTGEVGAVAGICVIALADAACRKGYAPGPAILAHMGADAGQRAAVTLLHAAPHASSHLKGVS
jgi:3-oxoacyl-[acyl-carrier-protein] synthase I